MIYVSEVEEFLRLCFPNTGILGPEDYTAIADWEKRGIPVEIVKRSIDKLRADRGSAAPELKSVLELEETVKQNFRDSLQLAVH